MRIGKDNFFHLTYCTNIHPGESWTEIFANLKQYTLKLKSHLAPNKPFGIGLRLSNLSTEELLIGSTLADFKIWLTENQLYVFTINGFVYSGFHKQQIKEQVYAPDWSTVKRRDYSLRLIKILGALTPPGDESGFSTSPLSYKPWLNAHTRENAFYYASIYLTQMVAAMTTIYQDEGKLLHIDIEPEPNCLIERTEETIQFFQQWLLPIGIAYLVKHMHISSDQAENYIRRHIRVCYDLCHLSVQFEKPSHVFKKLAKAGIQIGKIQISSALKVKIPHNLASRENISNHLTQLADSIYLHQVIAHFPNGNLKRYVDLSAALLDLNDTQADEWRIHFHVPIFAKNYQALQSTQSEIFIALKLLQKNKATRHLEIETYTWEILPPTLKQDLVPSLQNEYQWVLNNFKADKD